MTVSTIASLAAGVNRALGSNNPRLSSSIHNLLQSAANSVGTDKLAAAISLQTQVAGLRVASRNIVQANALVDLASSGANEISDVLSQLQDLASRAGSVAENDLPQFDAQFQSLRQQISRIVNRAQFDGQSVLDGTPNALTNANEGEQGLGAFTERELFGDANINLRTAENVKQAQTTLSTARSYVDKQINALVGLATGLDTTAAAIQAALQNHDASHSTLDEADFTEALFGNPPGSAADRLTSDIDKALGAQVKRIPPSLIELLGS